MPGPPGVAVKVKLVEGSGARATYLERCRVLSVGPRFRAAFRLGFGDPVEPRGVAGADSSSGFPRQVENAGIV